MCRILGHIGQPVALDQLLYAPPFSLEHQSFAPRHQDVGRINADGWGVAWYDLAVRELPARYRTATPMWADRRFREMAALISSSCVVASIRNASPGAPIEESGNAPFVSGIWSFAHNGYLDGFRDGLGTELRRELSPRRDAGILGASDSEVIFAMVMDRMDAGAAPSDALAEVIAVLQSRASGRFNLIMSSGQSLLATRVGNSLFTTCDPSGTVHVASEPTDDAETWRPVPDNAMVTATPDHVAIDGL